MESIEIGTDADDIYGAGWTLPSPPHKLVFQVAISMVLAFFLLELHNVMYKGDIVFSARIGLFQLGEAEKAKVGPHILEFQLFSSLMYNSICIQSFSFLFAIGKCMLLDSHSCSST